MSIQETKVIELMGGTPGMTVDALIRKGVPLAAIDNLSKHGVNAIHIGIINALTLRHRRAKGEPLSREEGDRIYRASKIVLLAEENFASKEKAEAWLSKRRQALGSMTALEAIATTPGYNKVEELLEQIHHGFAA